MSKRVLVRVCYSCFGERADLLAELRRLRQAHEEVMVVDVDCLDVCDRSPVVAVDDKVIAPATPEAVRAAVESALARL